jgi:1-acyl-sn-glycerol-3-phosphate acyltransferase
MNLTSISKLVRVLALNAERWQYGLMSTSIQRVRESRRLAVPRGWPKIPKDFGFRVITTFLRPLVGLLLRPSVTGKDHVPADGPLIVASNHLSAIDTLCLSVLLPRKVTFLAKSEYFTRSGIRGWLMARLMWTCGFVPVDRSSPAAGKAALAAGLSVLQEGGVFGVYPEGTRSTDGRLYRGRTGVARLALISGAPVLPVGLLGTRQALPPGSRCPRARRVHVVIGSVLRFQLDGASVHNSALLRRTTDEVMNAIADLSRQERGIGYAELGRGAGR